jgi:hypothetical protein
MDAPKPKLPWLLDALVAAGIALVIALLVHGYDCATGSTDVCLMSKGFFVVYWAIAFVVCWPFAAWIGGAVRAKD